MSVSRLIVGLLVVALVGTLPAAAQVTQDDLDRALAELEELRADVTRLAARYEEALARDVELQDNITALEGLVASRRIEVRELRGRAQDRAVEMYIDAAAVGLANVFSSGSPNEVDTRTEYLGDLGRADRALFTGLEALSVQLTAETEVLQVARDEQAVALADLESVAAELNDRLSAAQSSYNALYEQYLEEERARLAELERQRRAEEARRLAAEAEAARSATSTTTPAATSTTVATTETTTPAAPEPVVAGSRTCPVDGFTTFTDTWGARRSGGRFHQGVDMLAATGTPVVAVEAGVITRKRTSRLGGLTVWLRTGDGDEFYYAHLDAWAAGLSEGQTVSLGQKIGEVGTSGNAPAHIPHLHWEEHPGGGGAVNPTPLARALCG